MEKINRKSAEQAKLVAYTTNAAQCDCSLKSLLGPRFSVPPQAFILFYDFAFENGCISQEAAMQQGYNDGEF